MVVGIPAIIEGHTFTPVEPNFNTWKLHGHRTELKERFAELCIREKISDQLLAINFSGGLFRDSVYLVMSYHILFGQISLENCSISPCA